MIQALSKSFTVRWLPFAHRSEFFRGIVTKFEDKRIVPESFTRCFPIISSFEIYLKAIRRFTYYYEPPDMTGSFLYRYGFIPWEMSTVPVFVALAKRAKVIVDVGANSGAYTLLAMAANQNAIIHCAVLRLRTAYPQC